MVDFSHLMRKPAGQALKPQALPSLLHPRIWPRPEQSPALSPRIKLVLPLRTKTP